jgi:hypothetical protein
MADVKISALPLATTPLAGTEVLPIVQSATTDQVTVANLTAGRAVSASSLTLTTTPLAVGSGGTGLTSLTSSLIPFGNGTGAFASNSNLNTDGVTSFNFGGSTSSAYNTLTVANTSSSGFSAFSFSIGSGGANGVATIKYAPSIFFAFGPDTNDTTTPIVFRNNNATERMRITSAGNVGIGTTTPAQLLVVSSGGAQGIEISPIATASAPAIVCYNRSTSAYIGLSQFASKFDWYIGASPAMTLDASGSLAVGTSSASQKLYVVSASGSNPVAGFVNTTGVGVTNGIYTSIGASGNSTSSYHFAGVTNTIATWYLYGNGTTSYSSDARLKKNIVTTRDGYLDDLNKLRVVKYHWWNNDDNAPKELGLIAQEVETIFPNLVQDAQHESKDGIKHKVIKHSVMGFILIKAIQELAAEVAELKAKVA